MKVINHLSIDEITRNQNGKVSSVQNVYSGEGHIIEEWQKSLGASPHAEEYFVSHYVLDREGSSGAPFLFIKRAIFRKVGKEYKLNCPVISVPLDSIDRWALPFNHVIIPFLEQILAESKKQERS